jgi:FKBP-type peptidyl-prolyl cis-trans isomerase 2
MQLQVKGSADRIFKVQIVDLTDNTVTVDGNHPLAGNTLIFDVEMVEVVQSRHGGSKRANPII